LITPVIRTPDILFVTLSLPAKTVREFVALVRARPDVLVFASSGAGSNTHLGIELFRDRLIELGAEIFTLSPQEFGAFLRAEIQRWRGIVTKYKIALEP